MSNFSGVRITDAGQTLLAGVLAGSTITFTRLVVGDGTMPAAQTPETMTAVVSPRIEASITALSVDPDGKAATISARFSNESITQPIVWRELGLYAEGPDSQEVLYAYGYDTTPDTIPAAGPTAVESVLSLVVTISNDLEFTAMFDPSFVVEVDRIPEPVIDEMWGNTTSVTPPDGSGTTVISGMTEEEVEEIFDEEEEGAGA